MKLKFKFMPVVTTNLEGTILHNSKSARTNKNCLVFPCFSCKLYKRDVILTQDSLIIDVDSMDRGMDGCYHKDGYTVIDYEDPNDIPKCPNYIKDTSIGKKL